jgi:ribosomal protein S18 acetylase RimI-like enzyme
MMGEAAGIASMVTLVSMTQTEYVGFASNSIQAYANGKIASGQWSEADAVELARHSFDALLPQGLATPEHYLFTIRGDDALDLGVLWMALQKRAGKRIAYVYDVHISPRYRRRGYAAEAFVALENKARDLGFCGIALHVFGHNSGAQALYAKLGFIATDINMFKSLEPEGTT